MADASSSSFLSGVSDFFGSILQSPAVNTAVGNLTAPKTTSTVTLDAYGRKPGDPGYGTTTPPAGITAAGSPAWLKPVLIGGGVLLAVLVVIRLLPARRK